MKERSIEEAVGREFALPLKWLLELDSLPAGHGLAEALGDRYLCEHNALYRTIREAALREGYQFSCADTPLGRDYRAFGLATLHRILSEKTIPYFDTAGVFGRLVQGNPAAGLSATLILGNVAGNRTFHEAAHCVAHAVLRRYEFAHPPATEKSRFVLEAILAEAFANTVERLGTLFRHKPISDSLFYGLNSWFAVKTENGVALRQGAVDFPGFGRFLVIFLGFLEANLRAQAGGDGRDGGAAGERIARAAGVGCGDELRALLEKGCSLNPTFIEVTTPAWFGMLDCGREYAALLKAAWLDQPGNVVVVREIAHQVWEVAGKP